MKTTRSFDLRYYAAQALKTRNYGHTYVHVGAAHEFFHADIRFSVAPYGRSWYANGHKSKVYAYRSGKPVPSAELRSLIASI